jgi:hypothetical protein
MSTLDGTVLDSKTVQGNNFANLADQTVSCEGSVGGWQDGFFDITLTAPYDISMGDVTVRLTNTLDQGATDESIGYGDMNFKYEFDPTVEWNPPSTTNPDEGEVDPTALWENDCEATKKTCEGMDYYGGHGECAQGHRFWRTFSSHRDIHPGANALRFSGKIWTIDSWDGETFTVEMKSADGTVIDSKTF